MSLFNVLRTEIVQQNDVVKTLKETVPCIDNDRNEKLLFHFNKAIEVIELYAECIEELTFAINEEIKQR